VLLRELEQGDCHVLVALILAVCMGASLAVLQPGSVELLLLKKPLDVALDNGAVKR
jgi:hypothetical protein